MSDDLESCPTQESLDALDHAYALENGFAEDNYDILSSALEAYRDRAAPEVDAEALFDKVVKTIRHYHCHYAVEDADPSQPYPLIDALSHGRGTVATGISETEMLADEVNGVIKDHLIKTGVMKGAR